MKDWETGKLTGIDVQDLEGQNLSHLGEGLDDPRLALPQDGPGINPSRADAGQVERVGEEPLAVAPAVRARVQFQMTGGRDIPIFALDQDLMGNRVSDFVPLTLT